MRPVMLFMNESFCSCITNCANIWKMCGNPWDTIFETTSAWRFKTVWVKKYIQISTWMMDFNEDHTESSRYGFWFHIAIHLYKEVITYWALVYYQKKKNPQFPQIAIKRLLPFLDSSLWEARFSSYTSAKVFCNIFNAEAGIKIQLSFI